MTEVAINSTENTKSAATKKAAVIDDAFDEIMEGEISVKQFREFYQSVNEDDAFDQALQNLRIPIPDTSEWVDDSDDFFDFLKVLWDRKEEADLKLHAEKLFRNKLDKLLQLEALCKNIEAENIEIEKFRSTINDLTVFEQGEFVYVFLDYRLGVRNDDEAVLNAQKVAKQIYDICPVDKKPITVLMSSDPSINEKVKEQFQQEHMLEGVIRFSSKSDLDNRSKVSLLIKAYGEEFYSNHILQDYIQTLIEAAKDAQDAFGKQVMSLRVEDYEFLHNSVLQDQQQPLGDYLAWLYSSQWVHLLLKDIKLKDKQKVIDTVISKKPPLHHTLPSSKLSEIFMCALFDEDLGVLTYHPWEGIDTKVAKLPYLHLGDVFTRSGEKSVFMILNPQCDLERPEKKHEKQAILIIPGSLDPIENLSKSGGAVKTDFFIFEEKQYRIYWDLRNFKTVPYNKFDRWQKLSKLERKFRLKLPFALEIQQRFTSNMSRVGLPVSPPLTHSVVLEVVQKRFDNTTRDFIPKNSEYAFLAVTRNPKQEIRLTLKFALDFKTAIVEEVENLKALRIASEQNIPQGLVKSIEKLEGFIDAFDSWFFKNRSLSYLAEKNIKVLQKDAVSFTFDFDGNYAAQTPFLMNLITKPSPAIVIEDIAVIDGKNGGGDSTEINGSVENIEGL